MLLTHRRPDGRHDRYTADAPAPRGGVRHRAGRCRDRGELRPPARRDATGSAPRVGPGQRGRGWTSTVRPEPNRYFPPVELRDDELPVRLRGARARGLGERAGSASRADVPTVTDVPAYHDHNWGVWRDVTWEWGAARGERLACSTAGVYGPDRATTSPFFLTVVDSLGVRRVLRFGPDRLRGEPGGGRCSRARRAPERFTLTGTWEADTVTLSVDGGPCARDRDGGLGSFRQTLHSDARAVPARGPDHGGAGAATGARGSSRPI